MTGHSKVAKLTADRFTRASNESPRPRPQSKRLLPQ
jgi:hypothetical protein